MESFKIPSQFPTGLWILKIDSGFAGIIGQRALEAYRRDSGNPFATFASIEQLGGGGTAGAHPDSEDIAYRDIDIPGTDRTTDDIMLGFFRQPNDEDEIELSDTMYGYYGDIHFRRPGEEFFTPGGGQGNDGRRTRGRNGRGPKNGNGFPGPGSGSGGFLRSQDGVSSVPEPGSMVILGVAAVCGLGFYRRRK